MDELCDLIEKEEGDAYVDEINEEIYDESKIDTEEEALEDKDENPEDYKVQLALVRNKPQSREEQFKLLSHFYDADFIRGLQEAFIARVNELDKQNLPFWNL
jgi:hypothetical protein